MTVSPRQAQARLLEQWRLDPGVIMASRPLACGSGESFCMSKPCMWVLLALLSCKSSFPPAVPWRGTQQPCC